jgi:hypothetical protein
MLKLNATAIIANHASSQKGKKGKGLKGERVKGGKWKGKE